MDKIKFSATDDAFQLHPQLAQDSLLIGDLSLCRVLLMNDSLYPWLILVPRRTAMTEIHELNTDDRLQLWHESNVISLLMEEMYQPDKLNIAALGNMVAQLHIHHIARYRHDQAWPAPVWGKHPARLYDAMSAEQHIKQWQARLNTT